MHISNIKQRAERKKKILPVSEPVLIGTDHMVMDDPIRLTVLISGNGSNLQAVIDSVSVGELCVTIARVLSNRKDAFGLERAKRAGIPTLYHNLLKYKKQHSATPEGVQAAREEYDAELARLVLEDSPDLVACLGFMHVLSTKFLRPLEDAHVKIINLHPALPGAFNGAVSAASCSDCLTFCRWFSFFYFYDLIVSFSSLALTFLSPLAEKICHRMLLSEPTLHGEKAKLTRPAL